MTPASGPGHERLARPADATLGPARGLSTRIAVFADVHGDIGGLRAVLADIGARRVDETWCLGDIVGAGERSAACLRLVRDHCALVLAGNHDLWATRTPATSRRWIAPVAAPALTTDPMALDAETSAWLATLRPEATRHGIRCFHGGPKNPAMQFIRTAHDAGPYLLAADAITLVAHTHQPAAFLPGPGRDPVVLRPQAGERVEFGHAACVLNPGAVQRPQLDADPLAYWMLLDLAARRATWLGVSVPEPDAARSPYARWRSRPARRPQ